MRGLVPALCLGIVTGSLLAALGRSRARTIAALQERDEIAAGSRKLTHDLRGALSPALMSADILTEHADPAVVKRAQRVVDSVRRATQLLKR